MSEQDLHSLKYPIGEYNYEIEIDPSKIPLLIDKIDAFPKRLQKVVLGLSREQLNTLYRLGGWKIYQVVHHLCDSHLNAYIRFKLALTEDIPTIKPYDQTRWAELKEYDQLDITDSLHFLELLHHRWVTLLKTMNYKDFERQLNHPESGINTLKTYLGLYAWHGQHHLAQITNAIKKVGKHI